MNDREHADAVTTASFAAANLVHDFAINQRWTARSVEQLAEDVQARVIQTYVRRVQVLDGDRPETPYEALGADLSDLRERVDALNANVKDLLEARD